MIAQDTGSAIVGPARADVFWGAGEEAGRVAGGVHHRATFAMLVPREVDPVAAGTRMPLPTENPSLTVEANATTSLPASLVQARRLSQADEFGRNLRPQSRQQSGCSETSGAGVDCRPRAKPPQTNEVANRVFSGFAPTAERKASATWRREN